MCFLRFRQERREGPNCQLDDAPAALKVRFVCEKAPVTDDNTGDDKRAIDFGRLNFSLLLGEEEKKDFSTLQISEIVRTPDNKFVLSDKFIPANLSIAASDNLINIARRLLELLVAKGNSLTERRRQQPSGQIEFTTADLSVFWLLHTVNSFIPTLNHYYSMNNCHPEQLYLSLLSFAGQLSTFSPNNEIRPRDFPPYNHNNPSDCYNHLDRIIRELLETVISSNFVAIPLTKQSETMWSGKIADEQLLKTAQIYLTASGDVPERKIMDELAQKLKIASPEIINQLVMSARPGLSISYTARPPAGLPSRPDLHYFCLEKVGPFWDAVCRSSAIAIFMAAEFKELELKMVAVPEKRMS